jgi:DNA processing protein
MSDPRAYWAALLQVKGVGATTLQHLIATFGSAEAAWRAAPGDLQAAGLSQATAAALAMVRRKLDPETFWARQVADGRWALSLDEADYPALLRDAENPPPLLYGCGPLHAVTPPTVAIVGSRKADEVSQQVAYRVASDLAAAGVTVISGLAQGIDGYAHRAALESGGTTVAVFGAGLDQVYPPQHTGLAAAIARTGALLSEYPLGTRPEAYHFPARNRIIAALAQVTIVVAASAKSGALITAEVARLLNRPVFAAPHSLFSPTGQGVNGLIASGGAILLQGSQQVLDLLQVQQQSILAHLPPGSLEERILKALDPRPLSPDELSRGLELPIATISAALTTMELEGWIFRLPTGEVQAGGF